MENFTNEDILLRYPSCLRDNIYELLKNGQIGVSCMFLQINLPPNKIDYEPDINIGNTFTINIPYAGRNLQWEILFNDEDPTSAPDFDILNDTFLEDPPTDVIVNCVPSLINWNIKDSKSLINVIRELLTLYKKHQLEKLENEPKFSGIHDEYKRIRNELKLSEDDVEIYVDSNAINILLSLKLDFSKLPVYIKQSYFGGGSSMLLNPGVDSAILKISFFTNRVTSYLHLSPRLERVFGDYTAFHIPPYKKNDDMVEYIRLIYKLIDGKIHQINEHFRLKEEYFSLLLSIHGLRVLEYDNITFNKVVFLLEVDDFHFIVTILIGNKFPQEKPLLTLRSVYHKYGNGEPKLLKISNYPYSTQCKPEENIEKMFKHIHDIVPKFKLFSSQSTSN